MDYQNLLILTNKYVIVNNYQQILLFVDKIYGQTFY